MQVAEVTRGGGSSVADQISEMQVWLREQGIQPISLESTRILQARAGYRAVFKTCDEAERFLRRFNETPSPC